MNDRTNERTNERANGFTRQNNTSLLHGCVCLDARCKQMHGVRPPSLPKVRRSQCLDVIPKPQSQKPKAKSFHLHPHSRPRIHPTRPDLPPPPSSSQKDQVPTKPKPNDRSLISTNKSTITTTPTYSSPHHPFPPSIPSTPPNPTLNNSTPLPHPPPPRPNPHNSSNSSPAPPPSAPPSAPPLHRPTSPPPLPSPP